MNRQTMILAGLGAFLLVVVYWMFLLSPKRAELAETNTMIEDAQAEQLRLTGQLNQLRDLRREAPALEATLAAGEVLIPSDAAVPATLRQFQVAADDAAVRLLSIAPGRPTELEPGIATMTIAVTIEGSYFQVVDFLRRIEDPSITPRAVQWGSLSMSVSAYPTLTVTAAGTMFVIDREALVGGQ